MVTIYTELFCKECEDKFGISREIVKDTIAAPDQEQYLSSHGLTLVLYSKKMQSSYIVVSTHVHGQDLMVDLAFRLKQDLVEDAKSTLPFILMQTLALKFGLPVKIGERESKFIYNEIIPVVSGDIKKIVRIINLGDHPFVSSIWIRILQNSMGHLAQCALVFCIDMQLYADWLKESNE